MRIDTFFNAYDLMEMDILKLYTKENKLYMLLDCNTHLDLMGNGIRPEFNVSFHHMFIFERNGNNINLKKNIVVSKYSFNDGIITLVANGHEILLNSDPEVVENYV